MNMSYCLNSVELEALLLSHLEEKDIGDVDLKLCVDKAVEWQDKFQCLTYSFARIIERRRGSMSWTQRAIPKLFSMSERILDIQECDEDFVAYMLREEHSGETDLEVLLLTVARKLSEYCYGKKWKEWEKTLRD